MTLLGALLLAWGQCPACASPMGTTEDGTETCPDPECPYHVGESE